MAIYVTYEYFQENLDSLLDEVENGCETIIVQREGHEDIAMISANEYRGLAETDYLLRSPRNAERIVTALEQAKKGTTKPMSLEELRREVGLDID